MEVRLRLGCCDGLREEEGSSRVTRTGLGFMHDRKSTGQAFRNTPCTGWPRLASELVWSGLALVDLSVGNRPEF